MPDDRPDPRFRDQAAELLFPFGLPHRLGYEDRERWDRVAKALAEVEARVQAVQADLNKSRASVEMLTEHIRVLRSAANQRAAGEQVRVDYLCIGHPGWPDPLVVGSEERAREWLEQYGGHNPRVRVEKRTTIRAALASPAPAPRTETTPDEEVRQHPLHAVLADALRTLAPEIPTVRIWGRKATTGIDSLLGYPGNAWAGSPEDVADHLVRALLDNLPTIDGRWAITPTLEHLADPLPQITTTPPHPTLHDGDRISVADADGKGVSGYVAGWTTAPGGHPFVILCTMEEPGFPPPPRRHAPLCGALRGQDCTCSEAPRDSQL